MRLVNESSENQPFFLSGFHRYVQVGNLEINGMPDCRIQKVDSYTGRYRDMYLCDNEMQLLTAMEDHDYTCWLDPDGVLPIVKTRYRLK